MFIGASRSLKSLCCLRGGVRAAVPLSIGKEREERKPRERRILKGWGRVEEGGRRSEGKESTSGIGG